MAQPNNPFDGFPHVSAAPGAPGVPGTPNQGAGSYNSYVQGPPNASYQGGGATAAAAYFTTQEESASSFAPQPPQVDHQKSPQPSQMTEPYSNNTFSANTAPPAPASYHQPAPVPQQQLQPQAPYPQHSISSHANQLSNTLNPETSLNQKPMPTQQSFSSNALVVSNQPSNPYSGVVTADNQADPFAWNGQPQNLLIASQQNSSWAMQPPATNPPANSFDPFAAPPPPAPAPPQVAPPPAVPPPVPTGDTFNPQNSESFYSVPQAPLQQQATLPVQANPPASYAAAAPPPPPPTQDSYGSAVYDQYQEAERNKNNSNGLTPYQQNTNSNELTPYQQNQQQPSEHVNKYSQALAATAPSNAAPLPNSAKVVKSGFVLARISFRTILLKKWKQSYWVQYGDHTMLWFRSHSDFDDWLNNPYHTQQQRNFLIKLAVNFVHDLYKPNVRGYQVTQARKKTYKNQILKQFKLERWMDYGPTIAAAFASSDPKEVDELRQAIVECMRNTPVGDGIRATGAVRQDTGLNNGANNENNPRASSMPSSNNESGYYQSSAQTVASASDIPQDGFDNQNSAQDYDNQSVLSVPAYASQGQAQNYTQNQSQNYAQNSQSQFNYQNYAY